MPIAQTVTVGGVVLMALSLDDFPVGFTVRLRLLLAKGHPIVEEQRRQDAEIQHQWAEAARRGALEADDAEEEATFVGRFLPVPEEERAAFLAGFPPVPEWELEARDDRGRQYRNWGGESSWGSSLEGRAEPIFTPALDPAARELAGGAGGAVADRRRPGEGGDRRGRPGTLGVHGRIVSCVYRADVRARTLTDPRASASSLVHAHGMTAGAARRRGVGPATGVPNAGIRQGADIYHKAPVVRRVREVVNQLGVVRDVRDVVPEPGVPAGAGALEFHAPRGSAGSSPILTSDGGGRVPLP